jgi:hypothetical protein
MVATRGGSRHIVDDVRTNRFVIVVRYVVHFEFSSHKLAVRERIRLQTIWTKPTAWARYLFAPADRMLTSIHPADEGGVALDLVFGNHNAVWGRF